MSVTFPNYPESVEDEVHSKLPETFLLWNVTFPIL